MIFKGSVSMFQYFINLYLGSGTRQSPQNSSVAGLTLNKMTKQFFKSSKFSNNLGISFKSSPRKFQKGLFLYANVAMKSYFNLIISVNSNFSLWLCLARKWRFVIGRCTCELTPAKLPAITCSCTMTFPFDTHSTIIAIIWTWFYTTIFTSISIKT